MGHDLAEPSDAAQASADAVVRLHGELDLHSLPDLRARLDEVPDPGAPTVLKVDLTDVTFMDCSALGPILETRARFDGRLQLQNVPRPVVRLLERTSLSEVLLARRARDCGKGDAAEIPEQSSG